MFRKCEFCIGCVNVSLTSATELKVIPLCVNKKTGKVRVKVHLCLMPQKWRKWPGCFTPDSALWPCWLRRSKLCVFQIQSPHAFVYLFIAVNLFFACVNVIIWACADVFCAIFLNISDGLKHLEEIKFNKCMYIEDTCLERLSSIENLQETVYMMEVVSCGNVTDKGIIALHKLRWVTLFRKDI